MARHGKTTFAHLADSSGRSSSTSARTSSARERYALLEHFDLGDIVGVDGPLFRTRTGEVTVRVIDVELLAKSLRPLPFGKEEEVDGAGRTALGLQRSGAALPPAVCGSRGSSGGARAVSSRARG